MYTRAKINDIEKLEVLKTYIPIFCNTCSDYMNMIQQKIESKRHEIDAILTNLRTQYNYADEKCSAIYHELSMTDSRFNDEDADMKAYKTELLQRQYDEACEERSVINTQIERCEKVINSLNSAVYQYEQYKGSFENFVENKFPKANNILTTIFEIIYGYSAIDIETETNK